jgi:hypothetical protein
MVAVVVVLVDSVGIPPMMLGHRCILLLLRHPFDPTNEDSTRVVVVEEDHHRSITTGIMTVPPMTILLFQVDHHHHHWTMYEVGFEEEEDGVVVVSFVGDVWVEEVVEVPCVGDGVVDIGVAVEDGEGRHHLHPLWGEVVVVVEEVVDHPHIHYPWTKVV